MQKKAHYRRAVWLTAQEGQKSLAETIVSCLAGVSNTDAPSYPLGDGSHDCVVARRNLSGSTIYLHFAAYQHGAPAAAIETARAVGEMDASTVAPPDGSDFIKFQVFCVIRGDHVVWVGHNETVRQNRVLAALTAMIAAYSDDESDTQFDLYAKLDPEAFREAFDGGISEIDLGLGDFQASLESMLATPQHPFVQHLRALVSNAPTPDQVAAASNLNAKLVLRSGKSWDKPFVRELLTNMANGVLNNAEDEFVIVTKNGLRLTHSKMSISKDIDVLGEGPVLNSIDARGKLMSVMSDLNTAGLLEERE